VDAARPLAARRRDRRSVWGRPTLQCYRFRGVVCEFGLGGGAHPTITKLIEYQEFCGIPRHEPAPAPGEAEGEIDPVEVKAKIDRGDRFVLIDVREPHEYQICNIPYAKLIPLGELPKRVNELNSADEIVAHCKSGMRSAKAVDFLKQAGFKKVKNMKGGILAWSDKVDSRVAKY